MVYVIAYFENLFITCVVICHPKGNNTENPSKVLEHFIRLLDMSFGIGKFLDKIQVVLHKMCYLCVLTHGAETNT
jgi:hypothetical protein